VDLFFVVTKLGDLVELGILQSWIFNTSLQQTYYETKKEDLNLSKGLLI